MKVERNTKLNTWEYIIYLLHKHDSVYGTLFNLAHKNKSLTNLDYAVNKFIQNKNLTEFVTNFERVCINKTKIKIAKFVIEKEIM